MRRIIIRMTAEDLDRAYNCWHYTISIDPTADGNDMEAIAGMTDAALAYMGAGIPKQWYIVDGKAVNDKFGLHSSRYIRDKDQFLLFYHGGMDLGRLSRFMYLSKDRWFRDIVDNARRLQKHKEE